MYLLNSALNPPNIMIEFSQLTHRDVVHGIFCQMNWTASPHINMLKLYSPMWWSVTFWRWLGIGEIVRMGTSNGISATVQRYTSEPARSLPTMWGQWESSCLQVRKRVLTRNLPCWQVILNSTLQNWETINCYSLSHPSMVQYFMASQAKTVCFTKTKILFLHKLNLNVFPHTQLQICS